jgi:hypothetical protein
MGRILLALASLCFVLPAAAQQQYYISKVLPPVTDPGDTSLVLPGDADRIDNSGNTSMVVAATLVTCPMGVPSLIWGPGPGNDGSTVGCALLDQNSLGDQLLLSGYYNGNTQNITSVTGGYWTNNGIYPSAIHSFLVTHTGVITDLTATYGLTGYGINISGDIVGVASYANATGTYAAILKAGTTTLVNLNTLLSPAHASAPVASVQGLAWFAWAINDNGQIVIVNDSGGLPGLPIPANNGLTPGGLPPWHWCFVLTPCSAGSCPADVY